MKTQIRLNYVVPHGVSGPEAGAMNIIYEFLLNEYRQNAYSYISINQIGDDLNEVIIKNGKQVYLNIRYPSPKDFELREDEDKNRIRLEIIHSGLMRLAEKEKKLDIQSLHGIRDKILANKFSFDFVCKTYENKKNKNLGAKLIVRPETNRFKYYVQIEERGQLKCKISIYEGSTSGYYIADLFKFGKWKNDNNFVLTGKRHDVEIHIYIDQCKAEYVNLTPYEKAPFFEMFRSDISSEEKEIAIKNFEHSLPSAIRAIIKKADNQ
ncbi:MAG: hypothetical protein KDB99_14265 [Chitinophagaceae bacterium]|nr:hypothetical protein [Chitinophagaceae bacterium]